MDADLQHPPAPGPRARRRPASGPAPTWWSPAATRRAAAGPGLAGGYRIAVSRGATWLTKGLFPRALRGISDPMSGFFAIRRSAVTDEALQPLGYKILLELAVRCRPRG